MIFWSVFGRAWVFSIFLSSIFAVLHNNHLCLQKRRKSPELSLQYFNKKNQINILNFKVFDTLQNNLKFSQLF